MHLVYKKCFVLFYYSMNVLVFVLKIKVKLFVIEFALLKE